MALAGHKELPPIFHLHPEIKVRGDRNTLKKSAIGDKTFFGCEVETETPFNYDPYDFSQETGWLPTRDGSIRGAEWKSPLMLKEEPIHEKVEQIIDTSSYSGQCGGHIHVVRSEWGGLSHTQAWDRLVDNWAWLFAMLYPNRGTNTYCYMDGLSKDRYGGAVDRQYVSRGNKYNWLGLKSETRMEFRIFPAVHSTLRLRNRMRLLDILMLNFQKAATPEEAYSLTMDVIVPEMRKYDSMKNFPRKKKFDEAQNRVARCIYWPTNMELTEKKKISPENPEVSGKLKLKIGKPALPDLPYPEITMPRYIETVFTNERGELERRFTYVPPVTNPIRWVHISENNIPPAEQSPF